MKVNQGWLWVYRMDGGRSEESLLFYNCQIRFVLSDWDTDLGARRKGGTSRESPDFVENPPLQGRSLWYPIHYTRPSGAKVVD